MLELIFNAGIGVRDAVLFCADLLKHDSAPGLAVVVLLAGLAVVTVWFEALKRRKLAAIAKLRDLIDDKNSVGHFNQLIDSVGPSLAKAGKSKQLGQIKTAWDEYRETFVPHEEDGTVTIRNAVRPSVFFNVDDLGFSPGGWRIVPGLFVTIGLCLTFLGLISALHAMDLTADKVTDSLKALLTIASAKFIMSLTGLVCSIAFTILLRVGTSKTEKALHELCSAIEHKLKYISLEELAVEQLKAMREQREHFRAIGIELVAEMGRPFREEIPAAISQSISTAMAPLIQQIGQVGAEGMGSMVSDLSARFSSDVGRALSDASRKLSEAGDRLGQIAETLATGSGRMGQQMEASVARLAEAVGELRNSVGETAQTATGALTEGTDKMLAMMNHTLEQIRDHSRDGAIAMSAAAAEIKDAAAGFKKELEAASADGAAAARDQMTAASTAATSAISTAGQGVLAAFDRTAGDITEATLALSAKASGELLTPMDQIASRMTQMVKDISAGSEHLSQLRDGVRHSADAAERASGAIRTAAQDFTSAAEPLRLTAERMGSNIQSLTDSTRKVSETVLVTAQKTAESVAATLMAARETLGSEHRAVEAALRAVDEMVQRLKGQGERLDDIDLKLGHAFEEYRTRVEAAVGSLFGHVRNMQHELEPALDRLHAVVAQAEQFIPESRRR